MTLRPGSSAWLMRHELRLLWRRYNLASRKLSLVILVVGAAVLAQVAGIGVAALLLGGVGTPAGQLAVANIAMLALPAIMLSHALDVAVAALFERQDLDWLLASPVPLRRVLAVRMAGMTITIAGPWMLLVGPVANALALAGQPGWLAAYPVLLALGLLAAAAGTGLGVRLVAAAGLQRARRVVGGISLLVGALAFFVTQVAALMPPAMRAAVWDAASPPCCGMPAGLGWWPARALTGDLAPLLALLLLALAVAGGSARALARRFAAGAALSPPRPAGAFQAPPRTAVPFRSGLFRTLLRKELLLLRRTPNLLIRAAYQLIYLVPAVGVMWRDGPAAAALGMATVAVFVAGEAARLMILSAAGGDEAADLAATAPVPPALVRRAKMAAALLVAGSIVALPVLGVAWARPGLLPVLAVSLLCVTASGLLLGVWRPRPVRRSDLGGRPARLADTDWFGLLLGACWSGAAGLAMSGSRWAAAPAGLAVLVLALLRPRRRTPPHLPGPARMQRAEEGA